MKNPLFTIIDNGKTYKIYHTGKLEGFSGKAFIINNIMEFIVWLRAQDAETRANFSTESSSPTSTQTGSVGFSQGSPE